ncbi:MAG: PLP-dependent aminotransferase family protein [Cystobacter sp.]
MLTKDSLHPALSHPSLEVMNFLNEVTLRFPDAISFAPGRTYEGFYESGRLGEQLQTYIRYLEQQQGFSEAQVRTRLFQYGRTNGHIQELILQMLEKDEGIRVEPEGVVVTVGCQEGMFITLRALCATRRDVLLVSSPCYIGIVGAARLLDIEIIPVEEGEGGLDLEDLARKAGAARAEGKRPRALYVIPDFSNPSGNSMTVEMRHRLLEVAEREDLLLLEDNPYGLFSRERERRPTLKALDEKKRVIYFGSFAKSGFPGARVGYTLADQPVIDAAGHRTLLADELSKVKSMVTVNTSPISQALVGGMLLENDCTLVGANERGIRFYRENIETTLRALERAFPRDQAWSRDVSWNHPAGGFFLVMRLPIEVDEALLELSAKRYGVLWTPMRYFYIDGGGQHSLRLSCSYLAPPRIEEGIQRLARLIRDRIEDRPS